MFVKSDCIPCYIKQAISTLNILGLDEAKKTELLLDSLKLIPGLSLQATPGENSSLVLHRINELAGCEDPYYEEKKKWNDYILEHYDSFMHLLDSSEDRLWAAFKVAVAGNIIDMGINPDVDLDSALKDVYRTDFDRSDYGELRSELEKARLVLVVGDNAGEIVFDRVLVTELVNRGYEVIFAVKSAPILNDATMDDAEQVGITKLCKVITNGDNYNFMGVVPRACSQEFLDTYRKADVVIAKGHANFESLEGSELAGNKTFFVLKAKCPIVADQLGIKLGGIVLKRNQPGGIKPENRA